MIHSADAILDHDWGLDHGAWSVVKHMYPEAIIPVLQLSIDYSKGPQYHFDLAKEIYELRRKGILVIGSGNMVHNLKMIDWNKINEREFGYDWALKMDTLFKKLIIRGDLIRSFIMKILDLLRNSQFRLPNISCRFSIH